MQPHVATAIATRAQAIRGWGRHLTQVMIGADRRPL
jgi:hypothetical protein